ncbi:class I SAM-dependent DNA methyltransferase [Viridibacillus arvi]|uniref:class I SAM-dependent DNA methyltransferase n=1 Tax=Viridibacillus arvi TaxID=263475 RepID=UPI003D275ED2
MDIGKHYKNLFDKYGDSFKSAQWADKESQEKRFQILLGIEDIENSRILDFGCGTGHLATYLKRMNINVNYTGVDIVPEFISCAKEKHPEYNFYLNTELPNQKYDYIFISGVFNNKLEDNRGFYEKTLLDLSNFCNKGIAFNMLSHYVEYYDEGLFYENPETIFKFVKQNISPYIVIRNEYQLKKDIIPFEFTTYIYMK